MKFRNFIWDCDGCLCDSYPHTAQVFYDAMTKEGIDHGGSENYITGEVATGMGINGYNSLNVQVAKWDGEPIPDDVEVPQTILFA